LSIGNICKLNQSEGGAQQVQAQRLGIVSVVGKKRRWWCKDKRGISRELDSLISGGR